MSIPRYTTKKLYAALGIGIAIISIVALLIWQQFGNPSSNTAAVDQATPGASLTQPTPTPTPTYTSPPPSVIGYNGQDGKTALQLLLQLYPATQTAGEGVNTVVVAINGQPEPGQNQIWSFFLNGQLAQVAPATHATTNQDVIEWRLESF